MDDGFKSGYVPNPADLPPIVPDQPEPEAVKPLEFVSHWHRPFELQREIIQSRGLPCAGGPREDKHAHDAPKPSKPSQSLCMDERW